MTTPLHPIRPPAVWAEGLTRRFGPTVAVNGIDLSIRPGEFYGLLGPNGAGKTTTIKMLTGLLRPHAGRAGVLGFDTWRDPLEVRRLIGVLPEEFNLYERLTGAELLDFAAAFHDLPRSEARRRRDELLEFLDLTGSAGQLVLGYSRGMRKKLALAAAVIHSPPVLFLDEPFEGVDPVSARQIRNLLTGYVKRNATVVFSSHAMELVERLCTRVGILMRGSLVIEGTPDELRVRFGVSSVEDAFLAAVGADPSDRSPEWLGAS